MIIDIESEDQFLTLLNDGYNIMFGSDNRDQVGFYPNTLTIRVSVNRKSSDYKKESIEEMAKIACYFYRMRSEGNKEIRKYQAHAFKNGV